MANPLISAHRGGDDTPPAGTGPRPRPNSIAAVASAAALGADLIEIDVHLHHGVARLGHNSVDDLSPTLAQAIEALGDRAALHLDIKSGDADCAVVDQAVRALGIGRLIVTTNRDADVRAIRAWSRHHAPGLLVALDVGASTGSWSTGPSRVALSAATHSTQRRQRGCGASHRRPMVARPVDRPQGLAASGVDSRCRCRPRALAERRSCCDRDHEPTRTGPSAQVGSAA